MRPLEVNMKMIAASGRISQEMMVKLCQQVLDERGTLNEWKMSVVVLIFKEKDDVMNCGAYRKMKLLDTL